ncbi:MAG: DUF992 domain-containing protein [Anderseniella sp.]|nr:DUF992 domain-containing protein [Anderseniella sp.]
MKRVLLGLSLSAAVLVPGSALQAETGGVNAGVLTCVVDGGVGLLVFSSKQMDCEFASVSGRTDFYTGNVKKFGLDVGITGKSYVKWVVFAPVGRPRAGGLAGTYVGVSGEATAGAGVGANGLVGGSDRTFSLQPFSASVQTGLNLALGVGSMTLEAVE